jgi:CRISPR-associated protein Csm5
MTIKIQTLTPVHIGSGIELQGNSEYLFFPNERQMALVDEVKILGIIGEENIDQWLSVIQKQESLLDLLNQRRKGLKPIDVARRIIDLKGKVGDKRTMREQLHVGTGKPLVPGTSLKGALRTAAWATLLFKNEHLVKNEANLGIRRGDRFKFDDGPLSKKLFGSDPNHDIFRLLQVGDATFDKTACYRTEVVNLKGNDWFIKNEITQLIEAIPAGQPSEMRLSYNQRLANEPDYFNRNAALIEPKTLFKLINKHTQRLIKDEISYWTEHNPEAIGDYLVHLESLKNVTEQIKEGEECVMRLGWGTGFRNMTGDWLRLLPDDIYEDLTASLRPRKYEGLMFPKSMRLIAGGEPLGFIKMSM